MNMNEDPNSSLGGKITLDGIEVGGQVRVVRVSGESMVRRRIMDMGIVKGTLIEVIRRAPLGDPVEFRLKGYSLSLRRNEASLIEVEIIEGEFV